MYLAISLLVAVAIASVVGTVLQQNEPYQNYIIKFGPFWHEIFLTLGLYDVYSAGWFLFILAFLVTSTSVCIYRNAPTMVRDMNHFRLDMQAQRLKLFKHRHELETTLPADQVEQRTRALLQRLGYRLRSSGKEGQQLIAAKKGALNRLGYLFTHLAIVIICVGGLVDGNIGLKLKAMAGQIQPETRDIPASQVPEISWLPKQNPSYRGNVNIPEGGSASLVFLQLRDGYLVQPLPFRIALKDFRVEHYESGQPKSFESDLVVYDDAEAEPLEATIAVNHPLIYKGHAIYQASFQDGGSLLELDAWSLNYREVERETFATAVFENTQVETGNGQLTLEIDDFRLFNINPAEEGSGKRFQNYGPNIRFKLRNAQGEAREYENYMTPVKLEGRWFYLSGVREQVADPFFYLHIPADPNQSLQRFMTFNALLRNEDEVRQLAERATSETFAEMQLSDNRMQAEVIDTMAKLVDLFVSDGFNGIARHVETNVPTEKQMAVMDAYMKVLRNVLSTAYAHVLEQEGIDITQGISEQDAVFYDDAINTIASLPGYGSPFFLQIKNFEHIQSSGLQIAKAPGKGVVYFGFFLLCAGVFMMFYIHPRRLWVMLTPTESGTGLLLAGSGDRNQREFDQEFARLSKQLAQQLT